MRLPSRRALLVAGAIALAILVLAGAGWAWYGQQQRQVQRAWAETIERVQAAYGGDRAPAPEAAERAARELERFMARHPSAPMVPQAAFDLGNLRYAAGQHAAARAAWEIALGRGATPTLRALARLSIGAAWEAERNWAKAAETYQALAGDLAPGHFLLEEALADLARVQERAGQQAKAVETYGRLLKEAPAGPRAAEVRMRLAMLGVAPPR